MVTEFCNQISYIVSRISENHLAQVGGIFLGMITYLVDPGAAFGALWIAVLCDLISRIMAEAKNHGGFYRAAKDGHIRSDKILRGTATKIVAYFFMCVLAYQSRHIFVYEQAVNLFSSVIYSILFMVELWSMAENFEEAGVPAFSWITRWSKKKLEKIVDDGEDGDI